MELPADAAAQLRRFQNTVVHLNAGVLSLLASPAVSGTAQTATVVEAAGSEPEITTTTTHIDRARALVLLAQAVHAMASLLLKAKGLDANKTTLPAELERIKQYQKKVSKSEAEEILRKGRPMGALNIAVANRFISHAIPDLTPEQRERLRQANAAGKAGTEDGTTAGAGGAGSSKRAAGAGGATPGKRAKRGGSGGGTGPKVSARDATLQFLNDIRNETECGLQVVGRRAADQEDPALGEEEHAVVL